MSITLVNYSQLAQQSGTPTVSPPANIQDGDILIAWVFNNGKLADTRTYCDPIFPSGWTEWTGTEVGDGRCALLGWKRASSESGNYAFLGGNGSNIHCIQITAWRGAIASGDPARSISNTKYETNNTVIRAASLTPETGDALLWFSWQLFGGESSGPSGAGFSEVCEQLWYEYSYQATWSDLTVTAGATGTVDGSTASATVEKHAQMVVLKPAAAGISIPLLNHLLLGD